MSHANERESSVEVPPWAVALLPRFAWLAARWPWFAAPVAFHAWPWVGRMGVWTGVAISIAVVGHACVGGRAWQRMATTRTITLPASAYADAGGKLYAEADAASPPLFQDEVFSDAPLSAADVRSLRLHDGLSANALRMLSYVPATKDDGLLDRDEGAGAGGDFHGGDLADRNGASVPARQWSDVSEADLLAAIAAGARADAALPGLRSRARAAGVAVSESGADDAAQGGSAGGTSPDEILGKRSSGNARPTDSARVGGVANVVTQWAQWLTDTAKRHAVTIDRFAVDDQAAGSERQRDAPGGDAYNRPSPSDAPVGHSGGDVDEADPASFSPEVEASAEGGIGAVAVGALPHRAARIAIRGAFEPMAAFLAAIGEASPPLLIQAAQIMPDLDSNGSRLALQAVLFFFAPDQPRIAAGGSGRRDAGRSLSGADQRPGNAVPSALRLPASDAASPVNPFRRRGQAQTDIVVLATFASGGQRAVLLARHPGGDGVRGVASRRSDIDGGGSGDSSETALARPGETFGDVRVIAVEADSVRLRPLMGGADLVVRLARDAAIDYSGVVQ